MRTSETIRRLSGTTRAVVLESVIGVAATLAIAALCGAPRFGLGVIDPHPVWLIVLVIAARYGTRGLAVVVPIAWGALALAGRAGGVERVLDTLAMPTELGALAGTVLVGWIVSTNERRERALAGRVTELERRAALDTATIRDLRRAALALRTRNDRLDLSLTFLRNVAWRLQATDAEAAAQAALELIGARIGARAASIEMSVDGELRPLAVAGLWNRGAPDRTVLAVLSGRQPVRALELAEGGPNDSDIAAPIIDGGGTLRGVVAARGVPGGGSSLAALRDLAVIADWAAPVLCGAPSPSADATGTSDEAGETEEREPAPLSISPANV